MKKRNIIAGLLGLAMWPGISHAQSCGNDSIYKIPYKDTYVKQALVAENEFRVQQPKYVTLPTFAEAKQILPNPIWVGHEEELNMYPFCKKQVGNREKAVASHNRKVRTKL